MITCDRMWRCFSKSSMAMQKSIIYFAIVQLSNTNKFVRQLFGFPVNLSHDFEELHVSFSFLFSSWRSFLTDMYKKRALRLRGRDENDFQLHSKRKITINFLPWTVTFPLIFDSEVKRFVKLLYIYIFVNVQRKKLEK
jgi:hypothetical protein